MNYAQALEYIYTQLRIRVDETGLPAEGVVELPDGREQIVTLEPTFPHDDGEPRYRMVVGKVTPPE